MADCVVFGPWDTVIVCCLSPCTVLEINQTLGNQSISKWRSAPPPTFLSAHGNSGTLWLDLAFSFIMCTYMRTW
jgi:hypothetical protein